MQDAATRIKTFLKSDLGRTLLLAIMWQLVLTAFGILVEKSFSADMNTRSALLGHTYHWDAGWYSKITRGGYSFSPAAPVFYPLFPLAVRVVQILSFGQLGILASSLLLNTACTWIATYALVKISDFYVPKKYRWYTVALFLSSPAAFFMHLYYAEALFCAGAFLAILFALKRQWSWMGVVLAFLTAVRLPAILIVGLCGLEFFRAYEWKPQKILNKHLLWFFLAPLGFLLYGLYLKATNGDFLAMFHGYHATNDWVYHKFNPNIVTSLTEQLRQAKDIIFGARSFDALGFVNIILPLCGLGILLVTSAYSLTKKKLIPLGFFGLASFVFFTLNSDIISVHRYLLPCLSIYIAAIYFINKYFGQFSTILFSIIIYSGALLQSYLFILFVSGKFAG